MQDGTKKGGFGKAALKILSTYSYIFVFIALFGLYYITNTGLTWTGVTNILRHSAVIGIMSLGAGLVIITGDIDLSVSSILAFASSASVVVFNMTDSVPLLFLTALLVGALCGLINGLLVGKAKMPAFIVTLATMLILRSVVQYYCHILNEFYTGGGNNLYKLASTETKNAFFSSFHTAPHSAASWVSSEGTSRTRLRTRSLRSKRPECLPKPSTRCAQ